MKNRALSLVEGPIAPSLLRFALPFLLSSLLQSLYGAADLFVVGQFSGSAAVAGVAIGSQVMQTFTCVVMGLSMGGTVLIGRRVGENFPEDAARAIGTLSLLFLLLALLLTPAMYFCTGGAVALMETPAEAVADTRAYLLCCSLGVPFIVGYNAVSGVFRGVGDSKTPVFFIALACAINVAADFLLVGGLGMGAAGAAVATVLAQAVSFLASLFYIVRQGMGGIRVERRHLRLDGPCTRAILKVGFPLALQDVLIHGSFLIITALINTLGLVASAAVGVVEKIITFAMLPPSSFAAAVAPMSAQNLGAGKPERALRTLWCGVFFSLVCGVLVAVYSQIFPETLTRIFSGDPAVIAAAADYLRTYSLDCVLVSFVFCMNSYFSSCGKAAMSFFHSVLATFCVRIPLTYYFSRLAAGSLTLMGLAAPAATLLSLAICLPYLYFLRRRALSAASAL
ncbi:MAG: MATE family efflux transporter [Oscillospiraceae bacterium]|nr:MATE family efflux transporter [Oscillospiraceae bacterium]